MPKSFVGAWCFNVDFFVGNRVLKLDAISEEVDASVGISAPVAVFDVSVNWATNVAQHSTDLMLSARFKIDLKKEVFVGCSDKAI